MVCAGIVGRHMNKYKKQAREAQRERKRRIRTDSCQSHKRFESREDAAQPGMGVRKCTVCGGWHRYSLKKCLRYATIDGRPK